MSKRLNEFVSWLMEQGIVQNNLCQTIWMSGENTEVFPVTICQQSVELQWESDYDPADWIKETVEKFQDIVQYGYFSKSDGSCPSCVAFQLKEARY